MCRCGIGRPSSVGDRRVGRRLYAVGGTNQPISKAASARQDARRLDPDPRSRLPGRRPFSGDLADGEFRGASGLAAGVEDNPAAAAFPGGSRDRPPTCGVARRRACGPAPPGRAVSPAAGHGDGQAFGEGHVLARFMITCTASNRAMRTEASPARLRAPARSVSPDRQRRGVRPKCVPTLRDAPKRGPVDGSAEGERDHGADAGRGQEPAADRDPPVAFRGPGHRAARAVSATCASSSPSPVVCPSRCSDACLANRESEPSRFGNPPQRFTTEGHRSREPPGTRPVT